MCLVCGKATHAGCVDCVWKIYKCDGARGCKQACIVCGYVDKRDLSRISKQSYVNVEMWKNDKTDDKTING